MVNVRIEGRELVLRMCGWERFWSLRREIRVSLNAVMACQAAPELIGTGPTGLRAPGTYWPFRPGAVFAGSYFRGKDHWDFWCLIRARPEQILLLTVAPGEANGKYRRLIVEVDDPARVSATIRAAIGGG